MTSAPPPLPARSRSMKFHLVTACAALSAGTMTSCSSDILFATHTSAGLEVSGDVAKVPDHVNLGFRRREIAFVGKDVHKGASVLGKLDSQTNWNGGVAIRETFATGKAADAISAEKAMTPGEVDLDPPLGKPLVFASRTRIGFGFSVGGSDDDAIPSLHFGYNRRIATRMTVDTAKQGKEIPSVVADVTVHGSGVVSSDSAPAGGLHQDAKLSQGTNGGIRIRQLFAVGKGAEKLLESQKKSEELKNTIAQSPEGNTP